MQIALQLGIINDTIYIKYETNFYIINPELF